MPMQYETSILILFIIASAVTLLAKRLKLPYTVALIGVGLLIGAIHIFHPPQLTQELLYAIFLPGLIFEAAVHLKISDLLKDFWTLIALVVPGVILSTFFTAVVFVATSVEFLHDSSITWPVGILFGAAVAATDPVAVVALFRQLGAPRRLRILIEGESLLNDGTSIVIFILALQLIQGELGGVGVAALDFFKIVGLGLLIGVTIGFLADLVMSKLDDAMVVITITTIAAYGSFLVADQLGVSGVMSTVAAGLVCGNRALNNIAFPSIRIATESFWEYVSFALNSLIFLLIGFSIDMSILFQLWPLVLLAYFSVLIARYVVMLGNWGIFRLTRLKFPFSWSMVMGWAGIRGALSMILALSIPTSLPYKAQIVALVFGVVLLSILVQGLSMLPVVKLLKVVGVKKDLTAYEVAKAETSVMAESIEAIRLLATKKRIHEDSATQLENEFLGMMAKARSALDKIQLEKEAIIIEEFFQVKRSLLMKQKEQYLNMYQQGSLGYAAYNILIQKVDGQILEMENVEG